MAKHVIVIASGETERRSLRHLVAHLRAEDISVDDVRVPPASRALNLEMAEKLVKATWYAPPENITPDKFVILVDADGKPPDQVLAPFREHLAERLGPNITAALKFAIAQWQLEAWYFGDVASLRVYLGRDPGNVDTSKPDEIQTPKLHLKNLLGDRIYTALISEEIARKLDPQTIATRSPSFNEFLQAVRNGELAQPKQARQQQHD